MHIFVQLLKIPQNNFVILVKNLDKLSIVWYNNYVGKKFWEFAPSGASWFRSEVVNTLACHARDRGFDPRRNR